ncbi:MAG: hypothetical protein HY690_17860 [Chloroflexi bacterium]|nr:hypothetical protein [Chloroflexota bacterium]
MGERAQASVAKLRAERDQTLQALSSLSESDCRYPARWARTDRTVNFMLRAFSLHLLDHLQHAQKLLRDRGRASTEPQILLMKAQALLGEFEGLALTLPDEQFTQTGPQEGDWSVEQIIDHLAEVERTYREEILRAVAAGRGA